MSAEREPSADVATYLVDVDTPVVAGGFGLQEIGPAPVDLEALFLSLTGGGLTRGAGEPRG